MTRWVKIPGPGQYRGEGEWKRATDVSWKSDDWEAVRDTCWLPTHEGDEPPAEEVER